jgi:hypothetical protein
MKDYLEINIQTYDPPRKPATFSKTKIIFRNITTSHQTSWKVATYYTKDDMGE